MSETSTKLIAGIRSAATTGEGGASVLKIGTMLLASMMEHSYETDRINKLKEAASLASEAAAPKAVAKGSSSSRGSGGGGGGGSKSGKSSSSISSSSENKGKGSDRSHPVPAASQHRTPANIDAWPVFLSASWKLVPASALIWPERQFYDLPEDVQATLRRHAASPAAHGSPGSGPVVAEFLHPELRAQLVGTTTASTGGSGGGKRRGSGGVDRQPKLRQSVVTVLARKYLERCQSGEHGGGTVSIAELSRRCFAAIANRTPTDEDFADVMTLTRFAKQASLPETIGYVLVADLTRTTSSSSSSSSRGGSSSDGGGGGSAAANKGSEENKRLVPVAKATLGRAYGHSLLQDAAGSDLLYVLPGYDSSATPTPSSTRRWVAFFDSCGVHSSIAFEGYHDGTPTSTDIKMLPHAKLPQKRSSSKVLPLPYGLAGTLTKSMHAMVDFRLTTGWSRILKRALAVADPASRHARLQAFATLLSRCSFDHSEHVTKEAVPALAPGIRGEGGVTDGTAAAGGSKTGKEGATSATFDTPSRRRCLWLPPAHPGLSAVDCGRAQWARELRRTKWVPCLKTSASGSSGGGGGGGAAAGEAGCLMLPADVTLRKDPAKPYLAVLDLPSSVASAFASSGLADLLGFGTAPPPSPLAQLERCAGDPTNTSFAALVAAWVGVR